MAPVNCSDDFYAVLEVSVTAEAADIRRNYYRLAKLYHPDKNRASSATKQFQQLSRAYETLSDEVLRRQYDLTWAGIRNTQQTNSEQRTDGPPTENQNHRPFWDTRTDPEKIAAVQRRLELLKRRNYQRDIVTACLQVVDRIRTEIANLEAENARLNGSLGKSWWSWLGFAEETQEKETRDAARLQRIAAIRIRNSRLEEARSNLGRQQTILSGIETQIAAENLQEETRQRQAEEARLDREREQERQRNELLAERLRQMREAEARARAEQRARDEAAGQQEAERLAKQRAEQHSRANTRRDHATKSSHGNNQRGYTQNSTQPCRHQGWWTKIEGRHTCSNCGDLQYRFILKCPRCELTACAKCRTVLQRGTN